MFKIKIYIILISIIWINLVKLENINQTNIDYNLINNPPNNPSNNPSNNPPNNRFDNQLNDQSNNQFNDQLNDQSNNQFNDQLNNELNLKNDDTISQFTFNDKNLDYSLLNRYILENNHIFIDDQQQINQQHNQQHNQQQQKVYSFRPKKIMDTNTLETNGELYQNYLNLPTKSTLEKSFPKLYRQLYNLDKAALQKNLNQFFRSNIDNLSTIKQFETIDNTIKSIDAERTKVSTQNLQALSMDKANFNDRNKISTDTIKFESIDTIIENKTDTINNDKINNSIKSESSNKNESLIKTFNNQTSIDNLFTGYLNNRLNLTKNGKRLTYDDLKNLNPIEFKFVKLDKTKFNNKRYVPKIIYSKIKTKKIKKLNNQENDQQIDTNNQLKIIPISYILDDNLLFDTIDKQNTNYLTSSTTDSLIDNYQFHNLADNDIIYNLNNYDLIGTLIDNLIQNLPNNLLSVSNDLSDNQQLNGLLISNNVNKRSTNLSNKKKRKDTQLNINEQKNFIDQQNDKKSDNKHINKLNKKENFKKIELQKNKFRSFLNSLIKFDLGKFENHHHLIKYQANLNKINFTKPNCLEISNSTICFTGIKNKD